MSDMQPHVLISRATNDPEWTPDQVEAVALAIQQAGIRVSLDLWHKRVVKRHISRSEWQGWMDESIDAATHILCLVSTRYRELWRRKRDVQGVFGIAFESIGLIHHLYLLKQHNDGRILTLRPEVSDYDCIPRDLALDCPAYRWGADRDILLSNLADAPVASSTRLSDGLILDGLHYPDSTEAGDSAAGMHVSDAPDTADAASAAMDDVAGIGELSVVLEAHGISTPGVAPPANEVEKEKAVAAQPKRVIPPSLGTSGMWNADDAKRAPIGDFPPPWASAWGDDPYGLWADLTVNGATQRMRWIEPSGPEGFLMGSTKKERAAIKDKDVRQWANQYEHEPRKETVEAGFWLADTPCTQAFWTAVVGENPSHFSDLPDAAEHPVENVSWDAVMQQFIARFAAQPDWGTDGRLCLPSEAEWEYAARARTRTAYWWGDAWDANRGNVDVIGKRQWGGPEGTTPVQRYASNPWGLYDMHGNVWEWCADVWRERRDLSDALPDEPLRVVRGGSWIGPPSFARAAYRGWGPFERTARNGGFRFALRFPSGPEARGGGAGR